MSADCSFQVVESQCRSGDLILANDKCRTTVRTPGLLGSGGTKQLRESEQGVAEICYSHGTTANAYRPPLQA
jgi:hypothetical protein